MKQQVIEDGSTRTLKEFTERALKHLQENSWDDEVVQLANHITEIAADTMTRPDIIHPLPEGYHYRFSGFWGQVISVAREGAI